jgi:hypothetical protein
MMFEKNLSADALDQQELPPPSTQANTPHEGLFH